MLSQLSQELAPSKNESNKMNVNIQQIQANQQNISHGQPNSTFSVEDNLFRFGLTDKYKNLSRSMDQCSYSRKKIVLEPINRKLIKDKINIINSWPDMSPVNQSPKLMSSDKLNKQYKKVFASLSPLKVDPRKKRAISNIVQSSRREPKNAKNMQISPQEGQEELQELKKQMRHNGETQFCVVLCKEKIPPVKFRPKLQTLELDPNMSPYRSFDKDKKGSCRWSSSRVSLGDNIYDSARSLFGQNGKKSKSNILYEEKKEYIKRVIATSKYSNVQNNPLMEVKQVDLQDTKQKKLDASPINLSSRVRRKFKKGKKIKSSKASLPEKLAEDYQAKVREYVITESPVQGWEDEIKW